MAPHKRKQYSRLDDEHCLTSFLNISVEAHEASIIRGEETRGATQLLEAPSGKSLIALAPGLCVDRYDARLLLDYEDDILHNRNTPMEASSPTGWSDLPSDTEDTFFLNSDEVEDYRVHKRRHLIEKQREERVKARDAEENIDEGVWKGSDEEPNSITYELMRRTAKHIVSSSNPAQLEMRILANHGADERFAFLRGRWHRSWVTVKACAKEETPSKNGVGLLSGYGSDSDAEEDV